MALTLKQVEAIPATYPIVEAFNRLGFVAEGDAPTNEAQVWQRIEAWVSHRWTPRAVVWTVEGAGAWEPPLTPATITTVEVWEMGAWSETAPNPSPYGGYKFADVGP